jgi:hypothetical protein
MFLLGDGKQNARLQPYVDDPWMIAIGTLIQRSRIFAKTILAWRLLGFPLSFEKGVRGRSLTWIGADLSLDPDGVTASIPTNKLEELGLLITDLLSCNVVPIKKVRQFVGKAQAIAGIIYTWRPFLSNLWGAIAAVNNHQCPAAQCIWRTQIAADLHWLQAFLKGCSGSLIRKFTVDTYHNRGRNIAITTDASPWGIGAWLSIDNVIVDYFADEVCADDVQRLSLTGRGSEDQQVLEALALLVSLRQWHDHWRNERAVIAVNYDNVAALTMASKLKAKSGPMSTIARELALDIADSLYAPSIISHLPGVLNGVADELSRKFVPGREFVLPLCLRHVSPRQLSTRDSAWWRSMPTMPCEK